MGCSEARSPLLQVSFLASPSVNGRKKEDLLHFGRLLSLHLSNRDQRQISLSFSLNNRLLPPSRGAHKSLKPLPPFLPEKRRRRRACSKKVAFVARNFGKGKSAQQDGRTPRKVLQGIFLPLFILRDRDRIATFANSFSPLLLSQSSFPMSYSAVRLFKLVACLYFPPEQCPFGKGGEGGSRKGAAAAASGANMKDEASLPPRLLLLLGALESSVAFACVFARFERRAEEKLGAFLTQTTLQKHSTWKCRRAVEILPCSGKPHGIFRIRSA